MSFLPMDPANPLYRLLNPGMPAGGAQGGLGGLFGRGPSWLGNGAEMGAAPQQPQRTGLRGLLSDPNLGLALLANSGPSMQPRSFGQIFGQSALQAQQMQQDSADADFKRKYMEAQMQAMQSRGAGNLFGAVQPDKFTPESIAKFEQTGKYSDLVLRPIGMQTGRYNPGDFTPESWAEFLNTQDPSRLVRYVTPQNATVEDYAGGKAIVQPDKTGKTGPRITTLTTAQQEIDAAARRAQEEASAKAAGEAQGAQAGKAPAKASFDAALSNLRGSIKATPQGMLSGPLGTLTSYGDKKLFQSRVQQLSTELRTVYRIPGEGTLSDQEQRQYGLQLPSTDFPPEVNAQILDDLEQRTKLRLDTPVGNVPSGRSGAKGKETAAERAKRLGL